MAETTTVTWKPVRPDLVIQYLRGTSTSRGYHESWYEIVSRVELDQDDLKRLDACGLLGMGQAFHLEKSDVVVDTVPAVTIDKKTGATTPDPPLSWRGEPITGTQDYAYHRYVVKRICDSGD